MNIEPVNWDATPTLIKVALLMALAKALRHDPYNGPLRIERPEKSVYTDTRKKAT